jgi:hypothetical protein
MGTNQQENTGFYSMNHLYEFNNLMAHNNILLIYEGDFSQDVAKSVLQMTERKLVNENIEELTKRKIYNVMIETLQNICKHNVTYADSHPIFMISFTGEYYNIISGNPLTSNKVEEIKNKLDHINSLDEEGLKQLFKETRLKSTISDVGGAGLGFIDMAKRSGNKIHYQFDTIDNEYSYFTVMVQISNKG